MGDIAERGTVSQVWVPWYRDMVFICVATLIFVADQFTKYLVRVNLAFGEAIPDNGPFRIVHTFNSGSAFGLFRDQTIPLILASLVGIGVLLLVYRHSTFPSILLRFSLGLQIGGAAGNLLDRLRMGHVIDFVDVGSWPVFNIADASIVVGIVLLAWLLVNNRQPARDGVSVQGYGLGTILESDDPTTCPFCDWSMMVVPGGRRCTNCGAREWIESIHTPPDHGSDYP